MLVGELKWREMWTELEIKTVLERFYGEKGRREEERTWIRVSAPLNSRQQDFLLSKGL